MKTEANAVYILRSARIPFAKSQTTYSDVTRKELMVASLNGLVERYKLKNQLVGDTALGAVISLFPCISQLLNSQRGRVR